MGDRIELLCRGGVALLLAVACVGCQRKVDLGPVADLRTASAMRAALSSGEGTAGDNAAAQVGTGWATLRGQFIYDGDPPQRPPYNVTKEPAICAPGGQAPLQETLVVDSATNGIQNVAVYLRNASRVHESAGPRSEPIEFDQKVCVFLTHVAHVTVGETLQIKNSDPTGHNTNILGIGFNQLIPAGGATPYAIQRDAAIPSKVVCSIHPWMEAYLLAREDGYHAVTDAEGRFEIANLPAGEEIELQVWHEIGGGQGNGLVGASPDAPELKWSNRGRVTFTLQPDEVKEIKVIVPPSAFRG